MSRIRFIAFAAALSVVALGGDAQSAEPEETTSTAAESSLTLGRDLTAIESTSSPAVVEQPPTQALVEPATPSLPTPLVPVGPTESDFAAAKEIRSRIEVFTRETEAVLATADAKRSAADAEIQVLSSELDAIVPGTQDADRYFDRIFVRLGQAREDLKAALTDLRRRSGVPSTKAIDDVSVGRRSESWQDWKILTDEIAGLRSRAVETEARLRWAEFSLAGTTMQRLASLRTASFAKLSLDRRSEIFGTGKEGLEQFTRELSQVGLTTRYWAAVRKHDIAHVPELAGDYFALGGAMITLLEFLMVLAVALFVRARWKDWLEQSRGPLFRWFPTIAARRRLERTVGFIETVFPWLLLIVTLYFVSWAIGDEIVAFELNLAISLLYYYAVYRLAIDLVVAGILRLSTRYGLTVSSDRRQLIRTSVITFFRVVFGLVVLDLVSNRLLGGGYLSQLAAKFAGVIVALTLIVLMLRWRRELADAFLSKHSEGRIADLVRRTRDSWLGVLVAPASLVWILGRAVAVLARDFALGFEQTQRALAFLFRRRIEKEAEKRGYATGEIGTLPEKVIEAFSEDAIERGSGLLDSFPGLDELRNDLSNWRERGEGGSFLLTGERGVGKTTWLCQVRRDDVPVDRIELGIRATSRDHLCQLLSDRLGSADQTFDGLVRHLSDGEPRVVIFDSAQHLFLATVGGYQAWAAFTELINRTKHRVYWVCSVSAYAWKHLRAVRSDWGVFSRAQHLGAWNEEQIRELLQARIKASGLHFNYSSLVLGKLEGVSTRDHLIESAEGYARLLWDYADGIPRVAIHYFLRSLDTESENRLRVRLFRAPEIQRLDAFDEMSLFILAGVVTHESISAPHIAEATRYPDEVCRIHLDKFLAEDLIRVDDGLYRITTHWHRAVVRTLKRRNILTV